MSNVSDPVENNIAEREASALLSAGIPIDLTILKAEDYISRCQTVLAQLGYDDSLLSIKLHTALIAGLAQIEPESALPVADVLVDMAQREGGEVAHAYALLGWGLSHPGPQWTARRVDGAYQILDVATRHDEPALLSPAYVQLLVGLLEAGDIRTLDTALLHRRFADGVSGEHQPLPAQWFRCLRTILDGDAKLAARQAEELFAATRDDGSNSLGLYATQMCMIHWMTGDIFDIEDLFLTARREYPHELLWSASLAWLWLLQGRQSSAIALLRTFPDVTRIPRDRYWLSTLVVLGEITRLIGTKEQVAELRELLLPFAHHLVPVGVGIAFWGTVARTLGLLEEHAGLINEARHHLELAIAQTEKIGALAWHAEAQIELAEFALRHNIPGIAAYDLLSEAKATCEARGFTRLAHRAMYRPRIRVFGGFDVVSVCGTSPEWSSRKARELLKMLVADRGIATSREVYMHMLWPDEAPERLGNRFAVAINVIRRALDPQRLQPTQHYVQTVGDSVRLNTANLDIDLERFIALAGSPDRKQQEAATLLYRGDLFSDEPYADWAVSLRERMRFLRNSLG